MNPRQQAEKTRTFLEQVLDGFPGSDEFIAEATARITKDDGGRKYYDADADLMKFEKLANDELLEYTMEEVLDLANYAWMVHVRSEYESERRLAEGLVQQSLLTFWSIRTVQTMRAEFERSMRVNANKDGRRAVIKPEDAQAQVLAVYGRHEVAPVNDTPVPPMPPPPELKTVGSGPYMNDEVPQPDPQFEKKVEKRALALQAQGPDEFPFGYYLAEARAELEVDCD